MIALCTCKHEFQDEKYGKGLRVFNRCGKEEKGRARCTACLREIDIRAEAKDTKNGLSTK
jgi:hypothetical protein